MDLAYRIQHQVNPPYHFCFITNDGDFAQVITQLQEWNYQVSLMAQRDGINHILKELAIRIFFIPSFSVRSIKARISKELSIKYHLFLLFIFHRLQ
ncbi:MAG: NYN domain-containing protein [Candidatus Hodarchaeales archaeon]|jgi:hypothetical protein